MAHDHDGDTLRIVSDGRATIQMKSKKMPAPVFTEMRVESRHKDHDGMIRDALYFTSQWGYLRVWAEICNNHITFLQSRNRRLAALRDGKYNSEMELMLNDLHKFTLSSWEDELAKTLDALHNKLEGIIKIVNSKKPDYTALNEQIEKCRNEICEMEDRDEKKKDLVKILLEEAAGMYPGLKAKLEQRDASCLAVAEQYYVLKQNIFFNKQSSLELRLRINHKADMGLSEVALFAMLLNWKAISWDESFQTERDKYNVLAAKLGSMSSKTFKSMSDEIPALQKEDLQTKRMDYKFHLLLLDQMPKNKRTSKMEAARTTLKIDIMKAEEDLRSLMKGLDEK